MHAMEHRAWFRSRMGSSSEGDIGDCASGGPFHSPWSPPPTSPSRIPHIPYARPAIVFIPCWRVMPPTNRCHALWATDRQKCGIDAPPGDVFCQEHHDEYLSLKSAYEQATQEAEALEILFVDIGFKAMRVEGRDSDEVGADRIIVAKYIERLQSAIRGRQEVDARFSFPAVFHIHSRDYLHTLEAKLPRAKAVAEVLGGSPNDGKTRTALLQAVIETAATQSIPEARYRGRDSFGGLAICEARLTHTYQRCRVLVLPSNRFCAGHHEEFKVLKNELDLSVKHASEYRDQVRWGLQYREGRDPGVELCDFPINHEQLLDTVEMYDLFLQEEMSWRRKYAGWFSYLPGDAYGRQYSELREENERLISECLKRRGKVLALRDKLYYGWFATFLSLFGAGPSENAVE